MSYYGRRLIARQERVPMRADSDESHVLSRSSPEPLYRQLAARLQDAIRSGALKQGERLDSEKLLARRFQVSRITVRQAVEELVRGDMLVRKQGKGTFVTTPAVRHDLRRLHGLLGSLFSQSGAASARLLRYERHVPLADIRAQFGLRSGVPLLELDRLYLIGGKPVALAHAWLAPEVASLSRAKAELISTEDMMRAVGIRIVATRVSIRAETAGAATGRLLQISARAPVLALRREAIADDGAIKEAGRISFCSDSYELACSMHNPDSMQSLFDIRNVEA
jgi:GntR family transcriptional regulator